MGNVEAMYLPDTFGDISEEFGDMSSLLVYGERIRDELVVEVDVVPSDRCVL